MNPLLRSILAVLAGIVVCAVVIAGVEIVGMLAYHPPTDLDPNDREAMARWLGEAPVGALLFVLAAYAVGTLCGSWVAGRLAGRAPVLHGLIVAMFFLGASVVNLIRLPHPLWFAVACLGLFLPVAWLGGRLASPRRAPAGWPQSSNDFAPAPEEVS